MTTAVLKVMKVKYVSCYWLFIFMIEGYCVVSSKKATRLHLNAYNFHAQNKIRFREYNYFYNLSPLLSFS